MKYTINQYDDAYRFAKAFKKGEKVVLFNQMVVQY
jgi:hypothetical protein